MEKIIEDLRIIDRLGTASGHYYHRSNFRIIPYHENGEMSHIIWFMLIDKQDNIKVRINSKHVEFVEYV